MLTKEQIAQHMQERGALADTGQVSVEARKWLDREVKAGRLERYKGFWNTLSPLHGIGPLKTCWRVSVA